jgi:hypothetical protein
MTETLSISASLFRIVTRPIAAGELSGSIEQSGKIDYHSAAYERKESE